MMATQQAQQSPHQYQQHRPPTTGLAQAQNNDEPRRFPLLADSSGSGGSGGPSFDADMISQTAELADSSIFVTPRGRFRVERIEDNEPPAATGSTGGGEDPSVAYGILPQHLQQQPQQPQQYMAAQGSMPEQMPLTTATGFYAGNDFAGQYQAPNPSAMGPLGYHQGSGGSNQPYPPAKIPQSPSMGRGQQQQQQQQSYQNQQLRPLAHVPTVIRRRAVSTPSPAPSSTSSGSHSLSPQHVGGGGGGGGSLRPVGSGEAMPVSPVGSVNDLTGAMGEMLIQAQQRQHQPHDYPNSPGQYAMMPTPVSAGPGPDSGTYQGPWQQQGLPVVAEGGDGNSGLYVPYYRPPPTANSARYGQAQQQPQQQQQQMAPQYVYQPVQSSPQSPPGHYTTQLPGQMSPGTYQQAFQGSNPQGGIYPPVQQDGQMPRQYYPYRHNASLSMVSTIPSLTDGPTRNSSVEYSSSEGRIPIVNDTNEGPPVPIMFPYAGAQFDTQTPVLVVNNNSSPHQQPHMMMHQKSYSDATSQRDSVRPGEDLIFESEPGLVKTCPVLAGPFLDAIVKVFRNNLTTDLRFYVKVGLNSETYWMRGKNAQIVPLYAFDQRARNMVYVRDKTSLPPAPTSATNDDEDHHHQQHQRPPTAKTTATTAGPPERPTGNFQFARLADLFRFQGRLTGEDVVLDISTVRWVRLAKNAGRAPETTYTSVRVQLWHEPRGSRRTLASDGASVVTAGTALSGPVREKVVANTSRLMVFLGRMEAYISVFVTDDIEIERKKSLTVKLKARKYGGFSRAKSRGGVLGRLDQKRGVEPAGLDVHGQAFDPDTEYSFDEYKTFELEFENEQGAIDFCQSWEEVMAARRAQRRKLDQIREGMKKESFTGKEARKILL